MIKLRRYYVADQITWMEINIYNYISSDQVLYFKIISEKQMHYLSSTGYSRHSMG